MVKKIFVKTSIQQQLSSGLHSTIRGTLFSSRIVGLLPLAGLTHPTSDQLRFTLRSPYTMCYAASMLGQTLMFLVNLYWIIKNGISFSNVTNCLFYTSSFVSSLILVNIGRFWPRFIAAVQAVEGKLPPFTRNVARMSNVTMVFILVAALIEHSLSIWYRLTVAYSYDSDNLFEIYCQINMPWIFNYTSFAMWKGLLSEMFSLQSTFIWSYNDVLIMVISIYLTEHFLINHELLKKAVKQDHFSCGELRIQYLKIVRLVKMINGQFGIYILTSFGSNLYWICTQLFYSLNKSSTGQMNIGSPKNPNFLQSVHGIEHTIYFTYSFWFLMVRTLLVLLLAARIHSTSIAPLYTLYDVPSSHFDIEVERYIAQIKNVKIAMSGLDFFYVTRTMILTLLGTILTYELVLLQFNK